jgi:hypothetical protein
MAQRHRASKAHISNGPLYSCGEAYLQTVSFILDRDFWTNGSIPRALIALFAVAVAASYGRAIFSRSDLLHDLPTSPPDLASCRTKKGHPQCRRGPT